MRSIDINHGKQTIVDDEDFEYLNKYKWHITIAGYVERFEYSLDGNKKHIRMHRVIINSKNNEEIDHINNNRLDNRKINLRIVTGHQNRMNRSIGKNNTSGYKGVIWDKKNEKWRARIGINHKKVNIGYYDLIIDAAKAYNDAATQLFGQYAKLNDII